MMKQKHFSLPLLAGVIVLVATAVNAQTDDTFSSTPSSTTVEGPARIQGMLATARGNFMIGTGIGFSTSNSKVNVTSSTGNFSGDGGSATQLNLSPGIGYFFANNFAFGVGMDLIASRTEAQADLTNPNSLDQRSENSDLLFGPFARLYLGVSEDKAIFIGTTLGFGSSRDEFVSGTGSAQTIDNNIVTVGVGPGFTVFSRSGLSLEALVKYNYARSKSNININEVTRNSITRTSAFDFSVGLQYYFGGLRGVNDTRPVNTPTGRF
jgi:hypothetical protein